MSQTGDCEATCELLKRRACSIELPASSDPLTHVLPNSVILSRLSQPGMHSETEVDPEELTQSAAPAASALAASASVASASVTSASVTSELALFASVTVMPTAAALPVTTTASAHSSPPAWVDRQTAIWSLLPRFPYAHTSLQQWAEMFRLESCCLPYVFYEEVHPELPGVLRGWAIASVLQLATSLPVRHTDASDNSARIRFHVTSRNTFHRAVQLFDRFLGLTHSISQMKHAESTFHPVEPHRCRAFLIAALYIALTSEPCRKLSDLTPLQRNVTHDERDLWKLVFRNIVNIREAKKTIHTIVKDNISSISICEWVHAYLFILARGILDSVHFAHVSHVDVSAAQDRVNSLLSVVRYRRIMQLADVALLHPRIWMYYPSVLSAALLSYACRSESDLLEIIATGTGYTLANLDAPLAFISVVDRVVKKINVGLTPQCVSPSSAARTASSPPLAGDEVVTLHSFDVVAYCNYSHAVTELMQETKSLPVLSYTELPPMLPIYLNEATIRLVATKYKPFTRRMASVEETDGQSVNTLSLIAEQCMALCGPVLPLAAVMTPSLSAPCTRNETRAYYGTE
jgi:hypothetical protein